MIRLSIFAVVVFGLVSRIEAYESVDDPRQWAITGVSVIDIETGRVAVDQTIVIRNGLIEAVGDRQSVPLESEAIVLEYDGGFAIPGLWDAHVHIRGGPALIDANERWLRQYLGYGVTSVRDTGGDLWSSVLHWKAEVEQGVVIGPRIYTALRKLDGPGLRQAGSIPVDSGDAIDRALDYLALAGADFIKLYDFSFPAKLYPLAVRKAEARGMKTAAHIPPGVPLEALIEAGLDSVEHAFYLVKAANPDDRRLSGRMADEQTYEYLPYFTQLAEIGEGADPATARRVFRSMARRGTAITPTLEIDRAINAFLVDRTIDRARLDQTPRLIRDTHDRAQEFFESVADELWPIAEQVTRQSLDLVEIAADEGVMILAGSDTGTGNPFVYPGDSLHAELERLVEAGLSPLQALQSATIAPARWLGLDETFGAVSPGFVADIVVLESNPLDEIERTRDIVAVVQQGVHFDKTELAGLRRLVGD